MNGNRYLLPRFLWLVFLFSGSAFLCQGQELQPRRWSHLPMNVNFAGGGYVYTTGDIIFDPVLLVENVKLEMHSVLFQYIRTFEFLGKSARVDFTQGYQEAMWKGLLEGQPASANRSGLSDGSIRFAVNLWGAPPLKGKEFAEYRAKMDSETIVGGALLVQLPTGNYLDDKLLNIGTNRFTFKPQFGVVHNRGSWTTELTTAVWLFTDNDDFWNRNHFAQDPLYTLQAHLVYTFRPGLWVGGGVAYGIGGGSTLNGVYKDDRKGNLVGGVSFGIPISKKVGITFSYIGYRTQVDVGGNTDNLAVGLSVLW
ncbi:MAG: transporter [Verrucomicrobia bacterium]|nr:transporter [Verrucomicrobiota bacterium]